MTSLKKRILLASLSLLLLAPQSAFATVDVTNYSFEDYENKIGNLPEHYKVKDDSVYNLFNDLTLGYIYPLIKDEAFDGGYSTSYNVRGHGEMQVEENNDIDYVDEVIHFTLKDSNKKYIVLRTRKQFDYVKYKVYGRSGNEGKCFLEKSHPKYMDTRYSDTECRLYNYEGVDYVKILFYNKYLSFEKGEKNYTFKDLKYYKITEDGAEEVPEIPKKATEYDFRVVRVDQDIVDGFSAYYEMSNPDQILFQYMFSNAYINYYKDMKTHNPGEYDKFFKGVSEDNMNILKQSMLPLISHSESNDNGPIDNAEVLYFIFQEAFSQLRQPRFYNSSELPGYLFGKKDIYKPIKDEIIKNKNRMFDNYENTNEYVLDMTPFKEYLKRYYISKLSNEELNDLTDSLYDEQYIEWNINGNDLSITSELADLYESYISEYDGRHEIRYNEYKDYSDLMSISDVETYKSYASMRVDVLKDKGIIENVTGDLEEEAKDPSTGSIFFFNWPTEGFEKEHLTKYIIVEKDPKNEKLPFKIVYSTVYPIDKTILKKIVKSGFQPISQVEGKYEHIELRDGQEPLSEEIINKRAEEVKADNDKAQMTKYVGIGGLTLGILALLFFLKKKGGSKAILNNIEKAKKDREESKKIKEKIKAEQQRAREAEEQAKKEKAQTDAQANKQENKTEVQYCQNCGAKLQANDKFCISCGTKIDRDR